MASSAALTPTRRLMDSPARPPTHGPASGGARERPQFTLRDCATVLSSLPRGIGRLHLTVASPHVVVFTDCVAVRHPPGHARRFSAWAFNEAAKFASCYGPVAGLPCTDQGFYFRAF